MMNKPIRSEHYILLLSIVGLVPFLILFFYNHPATDDFGYTNEANRYGYWGAQRYWYTKWAGCLLPSLQMSVNPLKFDWFFGYKIIPLAYLIIFSFVVNFLIRTVFRDILTKLQQWSITFVILLSWLYYMPLINHGVFWLTGLATYQTPAIFTLLLLAVIYKIKKKEGSRNKLWALAFLLTLLIIQGSETYMVLIIGLLLILLSISTLLFRKIDRDLLLLFLMACIASSSVLLSPGIYNRAKEFPESTGFLEHFTNSFKATLFETTGYAVKKSLFMTALCIILIPVFDRIVEHKNKLSLPIIHPLAAFIITFFFASLIIAPYCWLNQTYPVGRVANTGYFYFVIGYLYFVLCMWAYLKEKTNLTNKFLFIRHLPLIFFLISGSMLLLPNNIRAAHADLLLGRAARYNSDQESRYRIVRVCEQDTCPVPPLSIYPVTLSYMDITTNPADWESESFALYFKKKAVMLTEPKK